jgi:glycine cleavage system H protein
MTDFLQVTIDKFTFKVATDRLYDKQGVWCRAEEDGGVRLGLSDYTQQRSGDMAFAEPKPVGTVLSAGDAIASIETVKVSLVVESPLAGVIREVNAELESSPEVINEDPYGSGWIVVVAPAGWEAGRPGLLTPEAYRAAITQEATDESGA